MLSRRSHCLPRIALAALSVAGTALVVLPGIGVAQTAMQKVRLDIPAQDLSSSLTQLGRETGTEIVFTPDSVREKKAVAIKGEYERGQALKLLLEGTGLTFRETAQGAIVVERSQGGAAGLHPVNDAPSVQSSPSPASGEGARRGDEERSSDSLDEIVVTGTHIRGAQLSSPVIKISQNEMRLAGQTDLGDVIRAMPQNFSGGQNPGVALGAADASIANQNLTGSSSLNLRGLGPDATLTLLNGRRLPYDSFVQAMDISVIPTTAVDRLEILLDGASSIYGSDAVGGVANVILKRDYDGAEVSARYGFSTDGGNSQTQFTGAGGSRWDSGGFLVAGDISYNSPVRAGDRDYLDVLPNPDVIVYPRLNQKTALFNGHQSLGDSAEFTLAAYHAKRQTNLFSQTAVKFFRNTDTTSWGVLPGLNFDLPKGWSLNLEGAYGRNESDSSLPIFLVNDVFLFEQRTCYCNRSQSADVRTEGPLFSMAGGAARLSLGGGYAKNTFESINLLTNEPDTTGSSRSHHAYVEFYLPVIAKEQKIPLVETLSVSAAARYEHYNTFGDVTTPKFGVVWGLLPSLQFTANWGKSFKVPTLNEQFQPTILNLNSAANDIVGAPPGSTYLLVIGGNQNLGSERAEVTTAGIKIRPHAIPGFTAELGWFNIDYSDRVVAPLGGAVDINAPEFVTRNPTLDQQNDAIGMADQFPNFSGAPYDPATVIALFDNRFTNSSTQRTRGVDVSLEYTEQVSAWNFTARGAANWLEGDRRNTSFSPETRVAGVVFFPPHFHARASMIWSKAGLALAAHLNYIGGVDNIYVVPQQRVSAMTTMDLVVDYQAPFGPLGDMGVNLSVSNLFDRHPPFMQPTNPNFVVYDSTNYSPLGRVLSATLTKKF